MINYNYVKTFSRNDITLYMNLFKILAHLKRSYPDFARWYFTGFIPGLVNRQRQIIYAKNAKEQIIAVSLLKKMPQEDKICCLWIKRNIAVGA